ncbi:MAG: HAD-IIA family hydrolase [Trichlorobacter sp.]|nr:HAD-IIA family hydrolase [Trichlorobacter sp.]
MLNLLCDMDGVIYRGNRLIDGADAFVQRLLHNKVKFLFLTNNSEQCPVDLVLKLEHLGIKGLSEDNFITSAMATAIFLKNQKEKATIFALGGSGLANELYNAGFSLTDKNPDYVVVGKTPNFNYQLLKKAVNLINGGAKFIGTNPDVIDPIENGIEPACGTILSAITAATGKNPYIIGKPNALMMTIATKKLGVHADNTIMVGDRMDTDIVGGMEAGMKTCLVLSGVTHREDLSDFPYKPDLIFESVKDIYPENL